MTLYRKQEKISQRGVPSLFLITKPILALGYTVVLTPLSVAAKCAARAKRQVARTWADAANTRFWEETMKHILSNAVLPFFKQDLNNLHALFTARQVCHAGWKMMFGRVQMLCTGGNETKNNQNVLGNQFLSCFVWNLINSDLTLNRNGRCCVV